MPLPGFEPLSPSGRAALTEESRRLRDLLVSLQEERETRERELEEVISRITGCESAIKAIGTLLGSNGQSENAPASSPERPRAGGSGDSIVEAIVAVFEARDNAPLHYRDLAELLAEHGVPIGGKDAASTLLAVLTNAKYASRFERYGRGTYRLFTSSVESTKPQSINSQTKPRKSRRRRSKKRH